MRDHADAIAELRELVRQVKETLAGKSGEADKFREELDEINARIEGLARHYEAHSKHQAREREEQDKHARDTVYRFDAELRTLQQRVHAMTNRWYRELKGPIGDAEDLLAQLEKKLAALACEEGP